jgi:hypothetical protein
MCVNQSDDVTDLTEFETELQQAMRHVDAPEGFAECVLAKAARPDPQQAKVLTMPRRVRVWAGGAIAAAVLAGVFVTHEVRLRHQRLEAERAQQQFETAMQITGETLQDVRRQLQLAGVELGD